MLDFRRRTRRANYLESKQQFKLLSLMLLAGLLVVLLSTASNPARWNWVFAGDRGNAATASKFRSSDTRLAARTGDPLGTFVSPSGGVALGDNAKDKHFPGVRTDYLQTVRDDTIFLQSEADAWFHLFELLSRTPDKKLAEAVSDKVGFRQLYQQPRAYRGRLVTLTGTARGVTYKKAPENSYEIPGYYQVSIEPDGEPNELVVAYVMKLPAGFPESGNMAEKIALRGFFFKRWAYEAQDAIRTAPLVVAKSFTWKPHEVVAVDSMEPITATAFAITALLVLLAIVAYWLTRWGQRPTIAGPRGDVRISESVLAAMADADFGEAKKIEEKGTP